MDSLKSATFFPIECSCFFKRYTFKRSVSYRFVCFPVLISLRDRMNISIKAAVKYEAMDLQRSERFMALFHHIRGE